MIDTENFKKLLETELESLVKELEQIAKLDESTGDWVAIPATEDIGNADKNLVGDVTEEWNERRATLANLEMRHRNVARAINKITEGTFGTCEIGGTEIELERLEANPAARTNIANKDRENELPL